MVYSLSYRRPPHVSTPSQSSLSSEEKQQSIIESVRSVGSCSSCQGIPDALSFDRIASGGTCPPCTLRDFLNYLKYIEHDAENLQFFLWLQAYEAKFNALPDREKKLSPVWTLEQENKAAAAQQRNSIKVPAEAAVVFKGSTLDDTPRPTDAHTTNPFNSSSRTPSDESQREAAPSEFSSNEGTLYSGGVASSNAATTIRKRAGEAYEDAGLKWQPFTIQPFRDEVARVIAIYIADGGARQLNISSKERAALLHALENTTHPSAFRAVAVSIEWVLRCQSHPNFIRWTICNGNRPRVIFARGLGVFGIVGGLLVGLLMTLSDVSRAWRVLAFALFFIGISTLIAAWKGMCVVLHGMHHRHLRPWELFQDQDDVTVELKDPSMDTLESYHSYEDEPWVAQYEKRNIVRKIFDRETWVQEPALRQVQDTIFVQAVLGAIIGGAILTAIFVAVPKGNFY